MDKRLIFNATQCPRSFLLARLHPTGVKNARAQRGIDFRSGTEAHQDKGAPPYTHMQACAHTRGCECSCCGDASLNTASEGRHKQRAVKSDFISAPHPDLFSSRSLQELQVQCDHWLLLISLTKIVCHNIQPTSSFNLQDKLH